MRVLSDEDCKKITEEVHQAYEEAVRKVAKESEMLNHLSRKKRSSPRSSS
jgi:hypothetical protein